MLGILSKIYGSIAARRNKRYDNNRIVTLKCPAPVFSVGALTMGGAGKTPFVETLALELQKMGRRPAIVGRGYKRKSKGEVIVSEGNGPLVGASYAGDEMFLLAVKTGAPVIAHSSKTLGALSAVEKFNIDSVIIDDGFQHRKLHRNLDILLIDKETLENKRLLPKGRLREPIAGIARADIVCLMGDVSLDAEAGEFIRPEQLIIRAVGKPGKPYKITDNKKYSSGAIKKMASGMIAVSGIAKPRKFEALLKNWNVNLIDHCVFPDHRHYSRGDVNRIINRCKKFNVFNIAVTEKDAVKLTEYADLLGKAGIDCAVFPYTLRITNGKGAFLKMIRETFRIFFIEKGI